MTTPFRAGSSNEECSTPQSRDGGSNPTPAHQFVIRKATHSEAKTWVEKWHYSHRIPTGKNLIYGLYHRAAGAERERERESLRHHRVRHRREPLPSALPRGGESP